MARNYGVPYMGSKSGIAEWVVRQLPPSHTLVDLFAGGCAVTHAAMLSGKWGDFIANDITDVPRLFRDAVDGKYANEERWISREEFFMYKDSDPYIRTCWSFGNKGATYLYSKELEPFKRALHGMLFARTVNERRIAWRTVAREFYRLVTGGAELNTSLKSLESLQSLESLERLKRLQSLKGNENLDKLWIFQKDYREVEIPDGATVYCDPPYNGVKGYGMDFDHDEFHEWLRGRDYPVYVSEYAMPEDFREVASTEKRCTISASDNSRRVTERIFVHERWVKSAKTGQMSLFDGWNI